MQTFNSLKEDFAFGQYRFQSLETVLAKDPGYVIWLRKTGKIEVNCLYIGASQAELDRIAAVNIPTSYADCSHYVRSRLFNRNNSKIKNLVETVADYYSEEDKRTYSSISYQGSKVSVSYNDDGTSTVYWGGPCGSQDYDENGEAC